MERFGRSWTTPKFFRIAASIFALYDEFVSVNKNCCRVEIDADGGLYARGQGLDRGDVV